MSLKISSQEQFLTAARQRTAEAAQRIRDGKSTTKKDSAGKIIPSKSCLSPLEKGMAQIPMTHSSGE